MCQRCIKRTRNLGRNKPTGRDKVMAHRLLGGQFIPVFADRLSNVAIEAHVERIMQARTNNRRYNRKHRSAE